MMCVFDVRSATLRDALPNKFPQNDFMISLLLDLFA